MKQKADQMLASMRAMGRSAYVLRFGVLGWGVTTAILFSGLMAMREGIETLPVHLLISMILFPAGGYVWGRFMWRCQELWCSKHSE